MLLPLLNLITNLIPICLHSFPPPFCRVRVDITFGGNGSAILSSAAPPQFPDAMAASFGPPAPPLSNCCLPPPPPLMGDAAAAILATNAFIATQKLIENIRRFATDAEAIHGESND